MSKKIGSAVVARDKRAGAASGRDKIGGVIIIDPAVKISKQQHAAIKRGVAEALANAPAKK